MFARLRGGEDEEQYAEGKCQVGLGYGYEKLAPWGKHVFPIRK